MRHPLKKDIDIFNKSVSKPNYAQTSKLFFMLESLLKSGIPILESLDIVSDQIKNRDLIINIKKDILKGNSICEAFENTRVFDPLCISIINAGEKSGCLDQSLLRLSEYYDYLDNIRKDIKSAAYYPVIIILMISFLLLFIIFYFVPGLLSIHSDDISSVNSFTSVLIEACIFIRIYFLEISGITILFIFCSINIIRKIIKSENLYMLFLKTPFFGALIKKQKLNNLLWSLEIMLSSGRDILSALDILHDSAKEDFIKSKLQEFSSGIMQGKSLTESLEYIKLNDKNLKYFISLGESTGDIEMRLKDITKIYSMDIKRSYSEIASLMQPFFVLVMTFIVAGLMFGIVLPLLNSQISFGL